MREGCKKNIGSVIMITPLGTPPPLFFSCPEQLEKPSCPSVGRLVRDVCEKVTFRVSSE